MEGGQSWSRCWLVRGAVLQGQLSLINLDLNVHWSGHPVVSCSQPNQDDWICSVQSVTAVSQIQVSMLLIPSCYWICSVQSVTAVSQIQVSMLLIPSSCCEGLHDGLLVFTRDRLPLAQVYQLTHLTAALILATSRE